MYHTESKVFKDLYLLPSKSENRAIVYSPLRGTAFMVDSNTGHSLIEGDYSNPTIRDIESKLTALDFIGRNVQDATCINIKALSQNLVILLSNRCNLGCKYCYAQYERKNDCLSKSKIKNIIDYVFELNQERKDLISIAFLGGGEPTLNWDLLKWSIEYAKQQSINYNFNLRIGFPTNATLLNDEKINFLSENGIEVGVSFEILPDIQDNYRPLAHSSIGTYQLVMNNLVALNKAGIQTRIRSTITPIYVDRMLEMTKHVVNTFPYVKRIHYEPIYPLEWNREDSVDMNKFYDCFIDNFFVSKEIGEISGIEVTTAATSTLHKIKRRYCKGELCVTPSGEIVICHRSSSDSDVRFERFKYGIVSDEEVIIDPIRLHNINQILDYKIERCSNCFSKWHCSGMCLSNREMFNPEQFDSYCMYVRKIQSRYLEILLQKGGVLNESK